MFAWRALGWDEDEALDLGDLGVDPFEGGNDKGGRLAGAILGARKNVSAGEGNRDAFFLDRRWLLEPGFEDAHEEVPLEAKVLELHPLGVGHILQSTVSPERS